MASARRLLKNFLTLFVGNVTGQFFYFLGLAHLARALGPGGFGLWNFAQAWLIYLFRGGEMGLEVIGVREIARNPTGTNKLISAVVVSRCVLAVILVGSVFMAVELGLIPQDAAPLVIAFSFSLIPMAFILEWVFEGHQTLLNVSIARIAKGVLFFTLVVLWVKSIDELTLAAFLYVLSITIPILFVGWLALRRFGCANIRRIFPLFPHLWKSALPVGFATLLSNYSLFLGTMVIGYTMQRDQLGYFTASHRIMIFLWAYTISSLQRVVLPTLSNLHQTSADSFRSFVEKFLRYAALLSIGVGLFVTSFSKTIIHILYSDRYDPSVPVLQILVWAFVMASIRAILEIALLASDKQKMYSIGMLFVATVYTVLTPWLVSRSGINGAAYAALIAESSYLLLLVVLWSRERRSDIWKSIAKFGLSVSVAIGVLFSLQVNAVLGILCAITIYLGLLLALQAVSMSELAELPRLGKAVFERKLGR